MANGCIPSTRDAVFLIEVTGRITKEEIILVKEFVN